LVLLDTYSPPAFISSVFLKSLHPATIIQCRNSNPETSFLLQITRRDITVHFLDNTPFFLNVIWLPLHHE
jgi:hypothetical protein